MKKTKHIINSVIWAVVGLYLLISAMVHIPMVQSALGHQVATALCRKLGTTVSVGRVDLGFLNRLIVDDVKILDQKGKPMLCATRLSVKLDYLALMQGKIAINSAQLFGMKANFYRASADAPFNFQFALDSLASKGSTSHKPLDLQINSLIIRHGEVCYNQLDKPRKRTLDVNHLLMTDLSAHIILNALQDDSLNVNVRKFSLKEQSGLNLKHLSFHLATNRKGAVMTDFTLQLPHSLISSDKFTASWEMSGKKVEPASLQYDGRISDSYVSPYDIAFLYSPLKNYNHPVVFSVRLNGTTTHLRVERIEALVGRTRQATTLRSPYIARLVASGSLSEWSGIPRWAVDINDLTCNDEMVSLLAGNVPAMVTRLGSISFHGAAGGYGHDIATRGLLHSDAGNASVSFGLHGGHFTGQLVTSGFNLGRLLDNSQLGILATNINVEGNVKQKYYKVKGKVNRMDFRNYSYTNINVDGSYTRGLFNGQLSINDPNVMVDAEGLLNTDRKNPFTRLTADIHRFNPSALNLIGGRFSSAVFGGRVEANFNGSTLNSANGRLLLTDFFMHSSGNDYSLSSLEVQGGNNHDGHFLKLESDFAQAEVNGQFDYATLWQSIENIVVSKLPSLQQLTSLRQRPTRDNHFTVNATISRSDWLQQFFGVPIDLRSSLHINGQMNTQDEDIDLTVNAPELVYDGKHLRQVAVKITSPNHQLHADAGLTTISDNGRGTDYHLTATAENDELVSAISIDNHGKLQRMRGQFNTITQFRRGSDGKGEARMSIRPSTVSVGDTVLHVSPSSAIYSKGRLEVNDVALTSGSQYIRINGRAEKGSDDSITVDLEGVNVEYVLDLVNFHSVGFSGFASGKAFITHLFDKPGGHANLIVDNFCLQDGHLGQLVATAGWNEAKEQIDINAQAIDTAHVGHRVVSNRVTAINGYVSPKRNDIDLLITPHNTRGEFIENFCSSFMNRSHLSVDGQLRLWGDLKQINLTGQAVVKGQMGIVPMNTVYTLPQDTIRFTEDGIEFPHSVIVDRDGNNGVVTGQVHHRHLSRFTADLHMQLDHLLAYDWDGMDGSTFYGTVYGTGGVDIKTRPGEINIDVDVTPNSGSQIVYNASTPDGMGSQDFIHWNNRDDSATVTQDSTQTTLPDNYDIPSDIRINFLVNTTPEATLKIVMDNTSGDYIALNGSGVIRADYYNKGGVDVFGNYLIDHGIYKLTVQNIIKRDFQFLEGGSIVFGGNPYNAMLDLKAQYPINSVSLSDLQLGRSFSGNNIRVNCLMNITGTPASPKVDFSLDMPTVGADAKQMIYSIINSEEEMNQQVLYLLAVGRFYSPGSNNAMEEQTGSTRTSLAMQSILSGQISQQLSSVLSSVIKNNNWNFGANISTGDEGWNNAEYEGLLSGRMFNNRLLFNGQFGYRDNANATTSFIGDFDIRYLIFPNGNLSMHVYNQTNDRYFTRNSLNTQGIGFIIKRDFNGWRDLLKRNKKIKRNRTTK